MKKVILTSVFVLSAVFGGLYAKGPGPEPRLGGGPGGREKGMPPEGPEGYAPWIIQMAGVDTNLEKFHIEMQRVKLEFDEQTIVLRSEQRKLRLKLVNFAQQYESNPSETGKQMSIVLKKLAANQEKIEEKRIEAMNKIREINNRKRLMIRKKINIWLNQLESNSNQMEQLVEILKNEPTPGLSGPIDDSQR